MKVRDRRILTDLDRHLRDKVTQDITDHMDLCRTAQLNYRDVSTGLMCFFSQLTAGYAAYQFNISEEDFLQAMRLQYRTALKREQEED
jgi:hypothetical protein